MKKIDFLRLLISFFDGLIIFILALRMRTALSIEKCKRRNGQPVYNESVEKERLSEVRGMADVWRVSPSFTKGTVEIFKKIIALSRNLQEEQRNDTS